MDSMDSKAIRRCDRRMLLAVRKLLHAPCQHTAVRINISMYVLKCGDRVSVWRYNNFPRNVVRFNSKYREIFSCSCGSSTAAVTVYPHSTPGDMASTRALLQGTGHELSRKRGKLCLDGVEVDSSFSIGHPAWSMAAGEAAPAK